MKSRFIARLVGALWLGLMIGASTAAAGKSSTGLIVGPVVTPAYSLSTFAVSESGYSDPDSVTFNANDIFIGYGNGGAPDGSGGAMSTIVEYDMTDTVVTTFTVVGHNDGLRINPSDGTLWALQNEDANPNLAVIDLKRWRFELHTPVWCSTVTKFPRINVANEGDGEMRRRAESKANIFSPAPMFFFEPNSAPNLG